MRRNFSRFPPYSLESRKIHTTDLEIPIAALLRCRLGISGQWSVVSYRWSGVRRQRPVARGLETYMLRGESRVIFGRRWQLRSSSQSPAEKHCAESWRRGFRPGGAFFLGSACVLWVGASCEFSGKAIEFCAKFWFAETPIWSEGRGRASPKHSAPFLRIGGPNCSSNPPRGAGATVDGINMDRHKTISNSHLCHHEIMRSYHRNVARAARTKLKRLRIIVRFSLAGSSI